MVPWFAEPIAMSRALFHAALYALFFASGVTALVFQILWIRGFSLVFGNTVYALSCVITVFMMGLALGSYLAALRLRRRAPRRPLLAYGLLELGVGATGIAITLALFYGQDLLFRLTAGLPPDSGALKSIFVHVALSAVLLIVPTACMGATLPVLAAVVPSGARLTRLYAFNLLGAATGSLCSSFLLVYYTGVMGAAWTAAGIAGAVFGVAALVERRRPTVTQDGDAIDVTATSPLAAHVSLRWVLVALAAFSGFVVLSCEVLWYRFLSLFLGSRAYAASVSVAVVLLGLAAGSLLCQPLRRRYRSGAILFVSFAATIACLGGALAIEGAAVQVLLDQFLFGAPAWTPVQCVFLVLLIAAPAVLLGLTFPLVMSLARERMSRGSAWVGFAYAANTIGAVAGSLVTAYVAVDALGSKGGLALNALLLIAGLVLVARLEAGAPRGRMRWATIATCAVLTALLIIPAALRPLRLAPADQLVVAEEDTHGVFSLLRLPDGKSWAVHNTLSVAWHFGAESTQTAQETQAYLPALYAPRLDRALNVGVGYGITAGGLTRIEELQHIDVVEILPSVVRHTHRFVAGNYGYDRDPRVDIHVADGRHFIDVAPHRYDIISVSVFNAYMPASSRLYAAEFYEAVKRRLSAGGVFCQYIFGPDIASLYHGIAEHFAYVEAVPSYDGLTVIASDEPLEPRQRERFQRRYADGRALFDNIQIRDVADLIDHVALGRERLRRLDREGPQFRHSDLHPMLELRRGIDGVGLFHADL